MVKEHEEKGGSTRAFIAIEINQAAKEKLAVIASQIRSSSVKAVHPDQMHITMAFLGDIDNDSIEEIGMLLSAMERSQFGISLMGLGTFSTKRPGVIFAKVLDGAEVLALISSYINDGLAALGMTVEERKFSAHVTVARARNPSATEIDRINSFVAAHSGDPFGSFICSGIKLKGSVLTPKGPIYRDLFTKSFSP